MTESLRKGQKLINYISIVECVNKGFVPSSMNVENVLWNMSDQLFDKIMNDIKDEDIVKLAKDYEARK